MSTSFTKKDLKSPDALTQELKKGFQWSTQHSKTVAVVGIALLGLGIGYSVYSYFADQAETTAQEAYFKAEKEFMKKKESFARYESTSQAVADAAKTPKSKDKKEKAPEPVKVEGEKASGDFDKDFGTLTNGLVEIVNKYPNSKAAQLAALTVSSEQIRYKKPELAVSLLSKVKVSNDLLSTMVLIEKGTAQSDLKDCKAALDSWNQALGLKSTGYFAAQIHLKQGLCYENLGDKTKSQESYNKVLAEAKDSPLAKSAEQYLRLLNSAVTQ